MTDSLLSVRDLRTQFRTDEGVVRAVDGVSFDVGRGETVCIVGESGSGKTVSAESITRLIRSPPGEVEGEVRFDGRDLATLDDEALRAVRGARIGHVFQNPQGSLNPVYTVGWQIIEAIQLHDDVDDDAARQRAIDLLDRVGIPEATRRVDDYPHEFSGGMKQRISLAMALATEPDLLIADEPTTALDVTIQRQILRLLDELQRDLGMSVLLITHDLGVVAEIADRVVVMYAGKVMERAGVHDLFEDPAHPYTRALLSCLPGRGERTRSIGGETPDPADPPPGCRFHPRCEHAVEECRGGDQPPLYGVADGHDVSCVHYGPGGDPATVRGDDLPAGGATDGGERVGPESGSGRRTTASDDQSDGRTGAASDDQSDSTADCSGRDAGDDP